MKISINIDDKISGTEIVINSSSLTPQIERIIATLRMLDSQIMVTKDEEAYILDVSRWKRGFVKADFSGLVRRA